MIEDTTSNNILIALFLMTMPFSLALLFTPIIILIDSLIAIKSILQSESTEVVSTASAESSDLHGVRECNANEETDTLTDAVVAGRLEKITDDEKVCNSKNHSLMVIGLVNRCDDCGASE